MTTLQAQFEKTETAQGELTIWWLGQSGFLLKSPAGIRIAIDPYLSNSLATDKSFPLARLKPPLLSPEDLSVDLFLCTHSHADHADQETISSLKNKERILFLCPGGTVKLLEKCNVPSARIEIFWPEKKLKIGDVEITGTFAMPTDDTDLSPLGFLVTVANGPSIYFTGDTDDHALLKANTKLHPDVMVVCINGGFNNLSAWEAAQFCATVKPKIAVPCHYGMFSENTADPLQFRHALKYLAPEIEYLELEYGKRSKIRAH